jgi:molecular chaperone HtpG
MKDYIIYKNLEDKYVSLSEYLESAKETHENQVYYVTDAQLQAQYIELFKQEGMDALYMTHNIDNPFITSLEARDEKVKFYRIDAQVNQNLQGEKLTEEEEKEYTEKLQTVFRKATGKDNLSIKVDRLKDASVSAILTQSEEARRMAEMMKAYGMAGMNLGGMDQNSETLVLNAGNDLVKYVLDNNEGETTDMVCCQLYDLAALANRPLTAEELTRFVQRSNEILTKLTK